MPRGRKPTQTFRRMQVVSPVPSKRRYVKRNTERKRFDIYVINDETGEGKFALTVMGPGKAQAETTARKILRSSRLLRKITHATIVAVEVEE
jgi:hypothetical protein